MAGSGKDDEATSGRTLRDVFLRMLTVAAVAITRATRLEPGRAVSREEPAPKPEDDPALAISTVSD